MSLTGGVETLARFSMGHGMSSVDKILGGWDITENYAVRRAMSITCSWSTTSTATALLTFGRHALRCRPAAESWDRYDKAGFQEVARVDLP